MLVDTPGIRSLELLDGDEGIDATYADIAALAADCRFPDCSHGPEPGCAVQAALASGELDPARYAGFEKLRREAARAVRERDPLARDAERRRWKAIHKSVGIHMKAKYGARQTP
jgi:ribosome biogenesis GTPase